MSRRDVFHDAVRRALEREGWTITYGSVHLIGREQLKMAVYDADAEVITRWIE